MSVSVRSKNKNVEEDRTEGFNSEELQTEPLDHIMDVLDELENKVLEKYEDEVDESNEAAASIYKLKA